MRLGKVLFVFPTLFTLTSVFLGILSIISSAEGKFPLAALSIVFSILFDSMDGRVARLTRTQSKFGVQIDSLADVVSFGVAPAILVYLFLLKDRLVVGQTDIGVAVAFLYVAAGAIRLARYNVEAGTARSPRLFSGLPIPGAAGTLAGLVLGLSREGLVPSPWLGAGCLFVLALLMVTTLPYPKSVHLRARETQLLFVLLILSMTVAAVVRPGYVLFTLFLFYVMTGLVGGLLRLALPSRKKHRKGEEVDPSLQ